MTEQNNKRSRKGFFNMLDLLTVVLILLFVVVFYNFAVAYLKAQGLN